MAVTKVERKLRKRIMRSKRRKRRMKALNAQPVIKNVDVEAIKAEFAKNKGEATVAETKSEEGNNEE